MTLDHRTIKIVAVQEEDEVNLWIGWDGDATVFIIGSGRTLLEAKEDAAKELDAALDTVKGITADQLKTPAEAGL